MSAIRRVALAFMLALDAGDKVVLLTVVLLWLVALLIMVLVMESLRSSFERQLNLERMSGEGVTRLFLNRDRLVPAFAGVAQQVSRREKIGKHGRVAKEDSGESLDEEPRGASDATPCEEPGKKPGEASGEASGEAPDEDASGALDEIREKASDQSDGPTPDDVSGNGEQGPESEGGSDA